jgi:hypothetical protein
MKHPYRSNENLERGRVSNKWFVLRRRKDATCLKDSTVNSDLG